MKSSSISSIMDHQLNQYSGHAIPNEKYSYQLLSSSLRACSYKAKSEKNIFFVKQFSKKEEMFCLPFKLQKVLLTELSHHELTPKLIMIDAENRIIVQEWIESGAEIKSLQEYTLLLEKVSHLHHMPIKTKLKNINLLNIVAHYVSQLKSSYKDVLMSIIDEMNFIARQLIKKTTTLVPVHGDFSSINTVLKNERCYLLDFEYASYAPLEVDFANLIVEDQIQDPLFSLMKNYFFTLYPDYDFKNLELWLAFIFLRNNLWRVIHEQKNVESIESEYNDFKAHYNLAV